MINFEAMEKYIDQTSLFDWIQGTDGEFYLFHFGRFERSCANTFELQAAQEAILRGQMEHSRGNA